MLQGLSTIRDLLLVILGFGFIVFIHELGHFLAARWAGIRVLAFAIGFGPALLSYRKGMGIRTGSGEKEYLERLKNDPRASRDLSPTEYRWNLLPLGGYVKMLGQEDVNPNAVSDAPDSYQNCKPWKRMVVISAGVIMNIITAALLFIVVFMAGLPVEPAKIGAVQPGSPAATTFPSNAHDAGVTYPGLRSGDEVTEVNGKAPNSFNDLTLATAMSRRNEPIHMLVRRPGVDRQLSFRITPEPGVQSGLLEIGIEPSKSNQLPKATSESEAKAAAEQLAALGFPGVEPGMKLVRIGDNTRIVSGDELSAAARNSEGSPFEAEFHSESGKSATILLKPNPILEVDHLARPGNAVMPVEHLLGLMPVMTVTDPHPEGSPKRDHQLEAGDIFARIGDVEFPSQSQGMNELKAWAGKKVPIAVLRKGPNGALQRVELTPSVDRKGKVGFRMGTTEESDALVSLPYQSLYRPGVKEPYRPAAADAILSPGTRILAVNDTPVANFTSLRTALVDLTKAATNEVTLTLKVQRPSNGVIAPDAPTETVPWTLKPTDIDAIQKLGWQSPIIFGFELEQSTRRASTPIEAIEMGLAETRRVMLTTYMTFARLAQGTVKVEHLKGPVGIAHIGTLVASKGMMNLLFFMALISINLAVINFLPLPIVDGGQFLFLVYEQVRGKPVPIPFQNAVTMAGLVLIASMFLIVTYNDISNLLGF